MTPEQLLNVCTQATLNGDVIAFFEFSAHTKMITVEVYPADTSWVPPGGPSRPRLYRGTISVAGGAFSRESRIEEVTLRVVRLANEAREMKEEKQEASENGA